MGRLIRMHVDRVCVILAIVAMTIAYSPQTALGQTPSAERGKYIFDAAGCASCHTDEKAGGAPLSGGAALVTPFGTFYPPNITPDPDHGIGRWSDQDFLIAMHDGRGPDGLHYYPAFPYTSFTKVTDRDLLDLEAYLFTQAASERANRPHDLRFPFSIRPLLWLWKRFNFEAGRWAADPTKSEQWNRGSYLAEALVHCGECHTPRNFMGGLDRDRWMAGARLGDGKSVAPNLTPHQDGLADWSEADVAFALDTGISAIGEVLGGEMGLVVRHSTSRLTADDRKAIAEYIAGLPEKPSAARRKPR